MDNAYDIVEKKIKEWEKERRIMLEKFKNETEILLGENND